MAAAVVALGAQLMRNHILTRLKNKYMPSLLGLLFFKKFAYIAHETMYIRRYVYIFSHLCRTNAKRNRRFLQTQRLRFSYLLLSYQVVFNVSFSDIFFELSLLSLFCLANLSFFVAM